jgi:DNA-binding LytR/AlgR family response regulator
MINCIIVDDELIAREIVENHLQKIADIHLVASCKNVAEAFRVLDKNLVDLIFLDINMPEISGLSFAKSINQDIKIIFTTAYREYAIDGFDLKAVDYLLKPISLDRMSQAVDKYLNENKHPTIMDSNDEGIRGDYIFVRADRKMVKINFDKVTFIESIGDYIKIHLDDETIVTREKITMIESRLPKKYFLRIHRSFIV